METGSKRPNSFHGHQFWYIATTPQSCTLDPESPAGDAQHDVHLALGYLAAWGHARKQFCCLRPTRIICQGEVNGTQYVTFKIHRSCPPAPHGRLARCQPGALRHNYAPHTARRRPHTYAAHSSSGCNNLPLAHTSAYGEQQRHVITEPVKSDSTLSLSNHPLHLWYNATRYARNAVALAGLEHAIPASRTPPPTAGS